MSELVTILVCLTTGVVTYLAFRDPSLRERLLFRPERILAHKEWYRMFSSALIHADWTHLGLNLFSLYSFGRMLEGFWGVQVFLLTYLGAVLAGSALSLALHRNHDYAALGASGGVCGVIFATIFLVPGTGIGMFLIPISIPGPVFAVVYLGATFFALRRGIGNIGHDAHFGGAIAGLLGAVLVSPELCLASPILFGACLLLSLTCPLILARDPIGFSGTVSSFGRAQNKSNIRYQQYDETRARKQAQAAIDRLLDKVSTDGLHSLSPSERRTLENASAKARRE